MQNENIFLKHKVLLISFIFAFFAFIFCHVKYSLGLFFDMPAMMLGNISQDDTFSRFLVFPDRNIRYFTNFLIAIPFNISAFFLKDTSILNLLRAFSASYLILHIFGLVANYLIALRTKRFDIAAICFAFYTFFSLQNTIWVCREVHIAVLFYFALLSYFLSRTKLSLKDLIPIVLITTYLFESFEISMIFGIILFIFAILLTQKGREEINRWYKVLIGLSGLFFFLYIPIKTILWSISGQMDLNQGSNEWLFASKTTLENLFNTNSLITIFALIAVIIFTLYKKPIGKRNIPIILLYIGILVFCLWKTTNFIPNPMTELQNYSFVFWFIYPVIITILTMEYFHKEINSIFLSNLIVTACIIGLIGISWQLNNCFEFNKYVSYLKELIKKSEKTFITIPEEDFTTKPFLSFNTCFGTMHKAIFISEEYEIKKLIMPATYYPDYTEYCMDTEKENYYDNAREFLYLQTTSMRLKNKYWDISEIKEQISNQ